MQNKPQYIIIHHSLTMKDGKPKTFEAVDRYHKQIFNFKSTLGWYIGYQYWIEDSGRIIQARLDTDPGAHTKQENMNYKSIGICLEGNFDVQDPNPIQVFALRDLMQKLCVFWKIPKENIKFHRDYAKYKSCPGQRMSIDFIRSLVP